MREISDQSMDSTINEETKTPEKNGLVAEQGSFSSPERLEIVMADVQDDVDAKESSPLAGDTCPTGGFDEVSTSWSESLSPEKKKGKKTMYSFVLLSSHVVVKKQTKMYRCDVCSATYRHVFSLKRHFLRNHVSIKYISKSDMSNCKINVGEGLNSVESDSDESSASSRGSSSKKRQRLTGGPKREDDQNVGMSGLYRCHLCKDTKFDSKQELKSHFQKHPSSAKLRFPCEKCDAVFSHKQTLFKHASSHADMNTFPCIVCGKTFTSKILYSKHVATHAEGNKCKYCFKMLSTRANKRRHERIHEGLKPYPCKYCNAQFGQSGDLKKHLKKEHGVSYLSCPYCMSMFSAKTSLNKHVADRHPAETAEPLSVKRKLKQQQSPVKLPVPKPGRPNKEVSRFSHLRSNPVKTAATTVGVAKKAFSCTICKKSYSTYISMLSHRRQNHPFLHRSRRVHRKQRYYTRGSAVYQQNLIRKKSPQHIPEEEFYKSVSRMIADNLLNYVDGKTSQLSLRQYNFCDQVESSRIPSQTWASYNFPRDFDLQTKGHEIKNRLAETPATSVDDMIANGFSAFAWANSSGSGGSDSYHYYVSNSDASDCDDSLLEVPMRVDYKNINIEERKKLIGRQVSSVFVCCVCREKFPSHDAFNDHSVNNHPNVLCTCIELEGDKDSPPEVPEALQWQFLNPTGVYFACSVPPPISEMPKIKCTKCGMEFSNASDLHQHIISCSGSLSAPAHVRTVIRERKIKRTMKNRIDTALKPGSFKRRSPLNHEKASSNGSDIGTKQKTDGPTKVYKILPFSKPTVGRPKTNLNISCPHCKELFRTKGLLNAHVNQCYRKMVVKNKCLKISLPKKLLKSVDSSESGSKNEVLGNSGIAECRSLNGKEESSSLVVKPTEQAKSSAVAVSTNSADGRSTKLVPSASCDISFSSVSKLSSTANATASSPASVVPSTSKSPIVPSEDSEALEARASAVSPPSEPKNFSTSFSFAESKKLSDTVKQSPLASSDKVDLMSAKNTLTFASPDKHSNDLTTVPSRSAHAPSSSAPNQETKNGKATSASKYALRNSATSASPPETSLNSAVKADQKSLTPESVEKAPECKNDCRETGTARLNNGKDAGESLPVCTTVQPKNDVSRERLSPTLEVLVNSIKEKLTSEELSPSHPSFLWNEDEDFGVFSPTSHAIAQDTRSLLLAQKSLSGMPEKDAPKASSLHEVSNINRKNHQCLNSTASYSAKDAPEPAVVEIIDLKPDDVGSKGGPDAELESRLSGDVVVVVDEKSSTSPSTSAEESTAKALTKVGSATAAEGHVPVSKASEVACVMPSDDASRSPLSGSSPQVSASARAEPEAKTETTGKNSLPVSIELPSIASNSERYTKSKDLSSSNASKRSLAELSSSRSDRSIPKDNKESPLPQLSGARRPQLKDDSSRSAVPSTSKYNAVSSRIKTQQQQAPVKTDAFARSREKRYKCPCCVLEFAYLTNFRRHVAVCQGKQEQKNRESGDRKKFEVPIPPVNSACLLHLPNKDEVEESMLNLLRNQSRQKQMMKEAKPEESDDVKPFQTYTCDSCHRIFLSLFKLLQHRVVHKLQNPEERETAPSDDGNAAASSSSHANQTPSLTKADQILGSALFGRKISFDVRPEESPLTSGSQPATSGSSALTPLDGNAGRRASASLNETVKAGPSGTSKPRSATLDKSHFKSVTEARKEQYSNSSRNPTNTEGEVDDPLPMNLDDPDDPIPINTSSLSSTADSSGLLADSSSRGDTRSSSDSASVAERMSRKKSRKEISKKSADPLTGTTTSSVDSSPSSKRAPLQPVAKAESKQTKKVTPSTSGVVSRRVDKRCPLCKKVFYSLAYKLKHMEKMHQVNDVDVAAASSRSKVDKVPVQKGVKPSIVKAKATIAKKVALKRKMKKRKMFQRECKNLMSENSVIRSSFLRKRKK